MANLQWQTIQSRYEPVQRFTPVQLQGFEDVINSVQSASSQVLERANQQSQQQQQNQNPQGNLQASVNNPTISQGAQSAPTSVSATNKPLSYQQVAYDQFRSRGLNHNQALGLVANIQAENSFVPKYLFGTHQDGNKTAYGALSWQGGREQGLLKLLTERGLYNNGKITEGVDSMRVMADYMVDELQSGKQGNYLSFEGKSALDYARYANKTFTRSSRAPHILVQRDKAYQEVLSKIGWNSSNQQPNNQIKNLVPNQQQQVIPSNVYNGSNYQFKHLTASNGIDRLNGVDLSLVNFLDTLAGSGIKFRVTEGMRTLDRQQMLKSQGKSLTLNSKHIKGRAVDLAMYDENGKITWDKKYYDKAYQHALSNNIFDPNKMRWGGNFKRKDGTPFYDGVHYELL